MEKENYKIGEVAHKFGISIRLLRYYDSISLLLPTHKDENGYRYYNASNLIKLEQILLLQMLNFSLQEIKEMFVSRGDISEELMVQEEFISNKIAYLSLIRDNIKQVSQSNCDSLNHITDNVKQIYSTMNDQFHDGNDFESNQEYKDQHDELISVLRQFIDDPGDDCDLYNRILNLIPDLNSAEYSSRFFTLLRLSKSNRFKLDEIDRIEKKMIKIRLSLDSTTM